MDHFASEDWVDFSRNLGSSEKRQAMEEHLKSDCQDCRAALLFWTETAKTAAREALYEPPQGTLRCVKAMGAMYLSRPERPRFALAELVMDSSQAAAMAGVRSTGTAPSLLLYKFGSVNIDLRIEKIPASKRISIIGQVMDAAKAGEMSANIQVAAMFDDGDIHKTRTNEFGEFQLELEPAPEMYLAVHIDKRMEIWLPLKRSRGENPQSTWS